MSVCIDIHIQYNNQYIYIYIYNMYIHTSCWALTTFSKEQLLLLDNRVTN